MRNALICVVVIGVIIVLSVLSFVLAPVFRGAGNIQQYAVSKVDEATNYELHKQVEDTCRAMIASYGTDKATYELYKDSDNAEKQGWAEQARMRANKTASTYNNYILENSKVWKNNVPNDIKAELPLLMEE